MYPDVGNLEIFPTTVNVEDNDKLELVEYTTGFWVDGGAKLNISPVNVIDEYERSSKSLIVNEGYANVRSPIVFVVANNPVSTKAEFSNVFRLNPAFPKL
jgi:hypothetical protein